MSKIIFIVGPTGVGKSDAAVALAKARGGEIVSCDSMQVYKEVNIACDKPTEHMQRVVRHHLINVVSVTESFDVGSYRDLAMDAITDIIKRGKLPIVAGGSGMYMTVLLDGIFQSTIKDEALRSQLTDQAQASSPQVLHQQLVKLDPHAAAKIHPNDTKRIIRALEVVMTAGEPISTLQKQRQGLWGMHQINIYGLNRMREELYAAVEARIERMFAAGLIDEVKGLIRLKLSRTASTLIGIPEVVRYLKNECSLDEAKALLKRNTRHFVKRQLTWFRREARINWIELGNGTTPQSITHLLQ